MKTKVCLDEKSVDLLKRVGLLLNAKYVNVDDTADIDDLIDAIWALYSAYDDKCEELEDYKQYVADNYKPISPSTMYGISDKDFI